MSIVSRARRAWSAWKAEPATTPDNAARAGGNAGDPDPGSERAEAARPERRGLAPGVGPIAEELREEIGRLRADFGAAATDAPALLEDLEGFEPSMIRQPVGAAQRVLGLLNDGNYSGAQLAEVIETDPAIAQSLLRHANATWYDEDEAPSVTSLVAAARRVGAKGVHAAVMSIVMEGGFARPGAGLDNLAQLVWDHMVRVAPMARQLGSGFGADADTAFTLGLCHDVGKLVLFDRIADLRKTLRRDITFPPGFFRAALERLHEPLGGLAVLGWGLPEDFATIVASHHRAPPPQESSPLSEAIFLVERLDLAMQNEEPFDIERLWRRGALTFPIERGAALVRETDQAAVEAALRSVREERERQEGAVPA